MSYRNIIYDDGGERMHKLNSTMEQYNANGQMIRYSSLTVITLYVSPYLVANSQNYTKHYYAGTERVASKLGGGGITNITTPIVDVTAKRNAWQTPYANLWHSSLNLAPPCSTYFYSLLNAQTVQNSEQERYYYHPDHLGSASWITDSAGKAIQHLQYLPFGETRVDQRATGSNWSTRYSFSAKEKDEESGYGYFGARYYDSDLSIWISVDPMASEYPSFSAYCYTMNNPIKLVDPNGMEVIIGGEAAAAYHAEVQKGAAALGIQTTMDRNGKLSAEYCGEGAISSDGQMLLDAINSKDVTVNINATNSDYVDGVPLCGGAFMGNQLTDDGISTFQVVNPTDLKKIDDFVGKPGQTSIHEITESYQGGLISLKNGVSSGKWNAPGSVYKQAHNAATPEATSSVIGINFDIHGNQSKSSRRTAVSVGFYIPAGDDPYKIKEVWYK
jgi:RHS repeat-associated protein